jgi:adenylate kinase family enzyme
MIICITGEPLAGKSTFAQALLVHLGGEYGLWSSGRFAREAGVSMDEKSVGDSDLSLSLNGDINDYAITLLNKRNDMIIEGWPRSLEQAMLLEKHRDDFVIAFVFTDLPLQLERMGRRGRDGDDFETILRRSKAALRFHGQLISHLPVRKLVPFTARGLESDPKGAIECLESYLVD